MAKLIPVAPPARLKRGKPLCVEHRGVPYCLVRTKKDKIKAFVTICTHKDLAMFPPDVKRQRLVCPYHDVVFDTANGKVIKGRGKKVDRLPQVAVEIVDDVIHLAARKKHRKLIPKAERKWVAKEGAKRRKKAKAGRGQ